VDVAREAAFHLDAEIARRALTDLPRAQWQVLELVYFEGLTQLELASRLLISLGTVKGRNRLGLDRLRTNLRQVTPPYGPSTRNVGGY
jgi:RNA polymerase sigma-70 factor (ECF subfamily)